MDRVGWPSLGYLGRLAVFYLSAAGLAGLLALFLTVAWFKPVVIVAWGIGVASGVWFGVGVHRLKGHARDVRAFLSKAVGHA